MTAQPSISHRDHWDPVTGRGLHEFRDAYWGARGRTALKNVLARPPLERFLHVRQAAVQNLFQMDLPDGLFFVREEHSLLADRLRKAREAKTASEMQGCLLLGHPGIGKTYFLLFVLMQCLSREETVLFTSPLGDTYLFDEDSVTRTRTADFSACTHIPEDVPDPSQRIWSLVDCPPAKEPILSSLTYGTRQLFFVAAARPDLLRCGELKERFNVRKWWLSHWTEDELRALLASLPPGQFPQLSQRGQHPLSDPNTTRSLIRDVGRCPRDILLYLTAPGKHEDLVKATLLQYTNAEAIFRLLSGRDSSTANEDSHALVLISGAGPVLPDAIDTDDRAVAHFKTRAIHNRVLTYFLALSDDDIDQLYAKFRAVGGPLRGGLFTAAFSGLLFETQAIHYVFDAEYPPPLPLLRQPFEHMDRQSSLPDTDTARRMTRAQAAAPVQFVCYGTSDAPIPVPDSQRTTIVLDAAGRIAWRRAREAERPPPGYGEWRYAAWGPRSPWHHVNPYQLRFGSVADLCAELPRGEHEECRRLKVRGGGGGSLFDVYSVGAHGDKVELWAVRVATPWRDAASVGEGEGGFAEVAQLKEQLAKGWGHERRVGVKYAVVVPYEYPGFVVEWSLPAEFEEHPGEVFVQFLDVGAFGGDVAQVLGVPRPDRDGDADDGAAAAGTGTSGMAKRGAKRRREEAE